MSSIITLQNIKKKHGPTTLFDGLSLNIEDKDRLGVLGPNGSGKSTLLKLLSTLEQVDEGNILRSRDLETIYVEQDLIIDPELSAYQFIEQCNNPIKARAILEQFSGVDTDLKFKNLSGGQKKKLQLSVKLSEECGLLLLDEPSNHLDLDSIILLESLLSETNSACVMISHDRWLLENFCDRVLEINPIYEQGYFICDGSYGDYLEKKEMFLEAQTNQLSSLKNKARTEQAWLRQGAKARTTKSKYRSDAANKLIEKMKGDTSRLKETSARISFSSSGRRTKDLVEFESINKTFGENCLIKDLSLKIQLGTKLGLIGKNGSGKSTLLKLITEELQPDSGNINRAKDLKITYFSQISELTNNLTLKQVLAPEGDSVVYNGALVHVASWASRFKFAGNQLVQPFDSLSGGEKARARIAKLMLESPDILLLDEPTNDLDINTLEVLEESLINFTGALVLVTHDRFMLSRVCDSFIGFKEGGILTTYSSYEQWFSDYKSGNYKLSSKSSTGKISNTSKDVGISSTKKNKLSYNDQREYDSIEGNLAKAEQKVSEIQEEMLTLTDPAKIQIACEKLGRAQAEVEKLYTRWCELEVLRG